MQRYRKGLDKRFPDYRRIYIFLDKSEDIPKDEQWLPVGYGWLSGFLLDEENNASLALEVRHILKEFREAVQYKDEESTSTSQATELVTSISVRHRESIDALWKVVHDDKKTSAFLDRLAELSSGRRNAEGQAKLALFQLYHRRPEIWIECRQQARYAPFYTKLHKHFSNLKYDVKRINSWYSLAAWEKFISPEYLDGYYYPVAVRVQDREQTFRVVTYFDLRQVRPEKREALREYATKERKAQGNNSPKWNSETFDLYVTENLSQADAVQEVQQRLTKLQDHLVAY